MPRYIVRTRQVFDVTYSVEADSPEGAYSAILDDDSGAVIIEQVLDKLATLPYEDDGTTVEQIGGLVTDAPPAKYRIERPKSTPLSFEGWRLSNVDSRDFMNDHARQTRDRWSDLSIYKTTTGKWVVAQIGKTRETGGFQPGALVIACETPADVQAALKYRSGHFTPVTVYALNAAIDADPELATAREEHI
jgi:hypothetical protein